MITYWLYHRGQPLQCVRGPEGMTEQQVKRRAEHDLEVCPGVFCEIGETPFERRVKIWASTIRF